MTPEERVDAMVSTGVVEPEAAEFVSEAIRAAENYRLQQAILFFEGMERATLQFGVTDPIPSTYRDVVNRLRQFKETGSFEQGEGS